MALHTLGTTSATALNAVTYTPGVLSAADLASISQGIVSDKYAAGASGGGVITTGDTNSSTSITAVASMTRIQAGMLVLGVGIVPGTYVVSVDTGSSTVTISQAATTSTASTNLLFVPANFELSSPFNFNGQLWIPRRGTVQVLPGDVVAIDNSGWPILLSANSIALTGSQWTYT